MADVQKKRIGIAIVVGTLLLCALFLAQGTTALLASAFLPLDPQVAPARVRRPASLAGSADERADGTDVLRRNIFDSETGDLTAQPVVATADDAEEPVVVDPNAPPPPCEGSIRLVGALVNARHPEWSFASIAGPDGKALLYRAGMSIEGREIMGIGMDQVFMRPSSGSLCTLAMFAPPQAGEAPRVAAAPSTPAAVVRRGGEEESDEGGISSSDMEAGINRVSDTEFTVARGLVDQLLENQAELMRTARIIPHQEGGRTVGVKLYGIRRNSLLGRLGLQNGDMLRTINGYDMTSPDSALEAYSRLRGANNLTVAVVRRGQAMNIDYNIQ